MKKDRIRQFIKLLDRSSMKWPVLFTVFYLSIILATLAYMPWIALLMLVMFLFIMIGLKSF